MIIDQLLTLPKVAEILQVKESTIYKYVEQGKIPHLKLNGRIRFNQNELAAWINQCKQPHEGV